MSDLFMISDPLIGWRQLEVTERHTRPDWAALPRNLVDRHFQGASGVVAVMDELNTRRPFSL